MKVRTRFAPSPTGRMHIGNLRTALYAYLIARHADGEFILRIEDTDQERYVEDAVDIIYRTLEAVGIDFDEGPSVGGPVGPYVQSERQEAGIYLDYARRLVERGEAYYCFCTPERLAGLKVKVGEKEIALYDKHCLSLTKEETEERLAAGEAFVIRQNNPRTGQTAFDDEIYGRIEVDNAELDDMILIKSDGFPTYNFANVIDDHLMGITHVVRGNEYLSSSPKYNRLYEAFGWEVPVYVHCPLITNEDHQKLSKRSGHASFEDLTEAGFLPEAITNYVALLGWSPEENREIFSLDELIAAFDYRRMNKAPAVFDMTKLRWMNSEYLKAMDPERFYELALPVLSGCIRRPVDLREVAAMVQTRIDLPSDIPALVDFIDELPDYDLSLYTHKKMKTTPESALLVLADLLPLLEDREDWSNASLQNLLMDWAKEHDCKNGYVFWPVRTAVSGKAQTPAGATELCALLGKDESLRRIRLAVERLSAFSGE